MQLAEHTAARARRRAAPASSCIARAGQNLSEYGLRYSHLGFAYREGDGNGAVWRVVHKLNQCGTARASLYRQGLGEFFLDDLWQYEAAIVVLAPEAQAHLRAALRRQRRGRAARHAGLQHGRVPVGGPLPAVEPVGDRDAGARRGPGGAARATRAQAWLRLHGYEPTTLHLSAVASASARA